MIFKGEVDAKEEGYIIYIRARNGEEWVLSVE